MPTYVFRCPSCGDFEAFRTMAAVGPGAPCPECDRDAPRRMTAPGLNTGGPSHAAVAAHERSAHAPGVVTAPPSAPARPADPRHARLPRP
ncbi:FmdB family zinc ribbon protein [Actinomycetospora atypica]|uniref:FmdB family zinc ribbon protein n=1 Tax=Actinomycetospora atypica TaxID=1290095 RepID=A0ABV9YX47_9PSEU